MAFPPGGQCLPYDWVDEGKLLLFVMEEVVHRAPRTGPRLVAARKRKACAVGPDADDAPRKHRNRFGAGLRKKEQKRRARDGEEAERGGEREESAEGSEDAAGRQLLAEQAAADSDPEDDEEGLFLMYNTVRGYISAINELWSHQVAQKLHNAPRPQNVAIKVCLYPVHIVPLSVE